MQALEKLQVCYCTLEPEQAWPLGLSVRWEAPMHSGRALRTLLLVRDGRPSWHAGDGATASAVLSWM